MLVVLMCCYGNEVSRGEPSFQIMERPILWARVEQSILVLRPTLLPRPAPETRLPRYITNTTQCQYYYSASSIIRTSIIRTSIIRTPNLVASRAQFHPIFGGYLKLMKFSFHWLLNFVDKLCCDQLSLVSDTKSNFLFCRGFLFSHAKKKPAI